MLLNGTRYLINNIVYKGLIFPLGHDANFFLSPGSTYQQATGTRQLLFRCSNLGANFSMIKHIPTFVRHIAQHLWQGRKNAAGFAGCFLQLA